MPALGQKRTKLSVSAMSTLGGGLNRSTQHSISFFLLGFESRGLAHTAGDPKVPGFSAAVKTSKKTSTCRHTLRLSPSRQRVLRRPVEPAVKADMCSALGDVRFVPIADMPTPLSSVRPASLVLILAKQRLIGSNEYFDRAEKPAGVRLRHLHTGQGDKVATDSAREVFFARLKT